MNAKRSEVRTWQSVIEGFLDGLPESNYMVYAKEDLGVIVAKTSTPPVILAINETNMTAAFWDYLRDIFGEKAYQSPDNLEEAKKLEKYISKIRNITEFFLKSD